MERSITKHLLTCMLLWLGLLSNPANGANPDTVSIKKMADSLFAKARFYEAGIYYQKLDFFLQHRNSKMSARLSAANCYKYVGSYDAGISLLNNTDVADMPDSVIFRVKFQCALMSYLNNELPRAESFLLQIHYLVSDSTLALQSGLLNALVLNDQYHWSESRAILHRFNNAQKISLIASANNRLLIDSIYNLNLSPKLKNSEKAVRMSTFFPGLGQCYAGYYGEGISSFLVISASAGAMVLGIIYQYYFTSILTGNLLIGKFYQGGIKRSEFLAEKYNYKKSKTYNEFLRNTIKKRLTR